MFSQVSVCLSFCSEGWGPHVTIVHDALGHGHLPPLPTYPAPATDFWWPAL